MQSMLVHKPEDVNSVPLITITGITIDEAEGFLDFLIEKFKMDAEEHFGNDFSGLRSQTFDIEELSEVIAYGHGVARAMAENKLKMDGGIHYEQN